MEIAALKLVFTANKLNSVKIPHVKGSFTHGSTHAESFQLASLSCTLSFSKWLLQTLKLILLFFPIRGPIAQF